MSGYSQQYLYPTRTECDPQIMAYQDESLWTEQRFERERIARVREINSHKPSVIAEIAAEKGELCLECGHTGIHRGGLCIRCWQEAHA